MNKLHLKVGLFTLATLVAGAAFIVYILYARGFFQGTYTMQLAATSADGVAPGVPVSFSGIEIGQVTSLGLNDAGGILIRAEFPARNAKWLKADSTFTLDKPIVGGARIRVDSPHLEGPALPDHSTMLLQTSDVMRELPALIERVKAILANVEYLTRKDGEINATLANVKTVTGRMTGEYGVLEGVLGTPEKARAVTDTLAQTRALMRRIDAMTAKTDRWLFDADGVAAQSTAAVGQVRAMLVDAQASLKKADALMANAVAISANVRDGTQDLAKLRTEIDDAVRKANGLVNRINRKWPFAHDPEVKLP